MSIAVKTKYWGNSLGIIIPSEMVDEFSLNPGDEVVIELHKKQNVLKELFGTIKFKKSTKEILNEVREELKSKWF